MIGGSMKATLKNEQGGGVLTSIHITMVHLKIILGQLLNAFRIPGLIAECDYEAGICKANIKVRYGPLFTIISVNGLDIYFRRLTGQIGGVGFNQISDCKSAAIPKLVDFVAEPSYSQAKVQN